MARSLGKVAVLFGLVLGCRAGVVQAPDPPALIEAQAHVDVVPEALIATATEPEGEPLPDTMLAYTAPGELPQLIILDAEGKPSNLPLKHTDVDARVRGHVAQVRVAQEFRNDQREAIEVTYTFPLPENAAVDAMRMVVGERVIEGEVQARAQARDTYERARAEGHTSALLEQERPNIFTQSLANIPPGETIVVEISYLQTLSQDAGTYEFVFPMVVGPRFCPPGGVADEARILVPVLGEGVRAGHDVSLSLDVAIGSKIVGWDSRTHTVTGQSTHAGFSAELADAETIPNRDFVIRWSAAGDTTQARLLLGPKDAKGKGHFALIIQPPALDLDQLVGQRELIFVVDRSGSMWGVPLALAKQTLREGLRGLRPVDTFNVIGFESGTQQAFATSRPANETNLVLAERFIDGLQAGGGTMMAGAVEAALAPALSEGRNRYVFFLTDGFIGNETEIFSNARGLVRRAEDQGLRSRVFGVGIGAAPNRELIAGISSAGEGVDLYVGNREDPREVVEAWQRLVDHPVLETMKIDWGGLKVANLYPSELPDLFASHSVVLLGRYGGSPSGDVTLVAKNPATGMAVTIPVVVMSSELDDRILATLFAREQIASLTAAAWDGALAPDELERSVTAIGLEQHLVTAYTSVVAVDRSRVVGDGDPLTIRQPVEVPEDVDPLRAGSVMVGATSAGLSLSVEEAKKLPVGSTASRDFTAVVDLAPGDGLGLVQEYVLAGGMSGGGAGDSSSRAKFRLASLATSEGSRALALRRSLERKADEFEACYVQKVGVEGRHSIALRLSFDAGGKLVKIEILSGTIGSEAGDACVETVLRAMTWKGLPKGRAAVEVEFDLRMR